MADEQASDRQTGRFDRHLRWTKYWIFILIVLGLSPRMFHPLCYAKGDLSPGCALLFAKELQSFMTKLFGICSNSTQTMLRSVPVSRRILPLLFLIFVFVILFSLVFGEPVDGG